MTCANCGHQNRPEASYCEACGTRLAVRCPACATETRPEARFCDNCGTALTSGAPPATKPARDTQAPVVREVAALQGERRNVTVLFIDAAGSVETGNRLDAEELHALVQRCTEVMTEAVHRFGGTVTQFRGDGIMALFGAPVAHEDSAHRAVAAAVAMRDGLQEFAVDLRSRGVRPFAYRIGLNTGPVVVGRIGDDLSMDYTAIGDTVNLASRMEQWAPPWSIYITETTRRLVAPHFELRDLGMLEVRGKSEMIRAHEVLRALPERTRFEVATERGLTPYVGRDEELGILRGYFEQARRGQGQVVFITAEAGMGKTRLMLEFRRSLEGEDVRWIEGHCSSYGTGMPYLPVIDLLKRAAGVEEGDLDDDISKRVDDLVRAWDAVAAGAAPHLKYLLGASGDDAEAAKLDPRERRAGILDALRTFVTQESRRAPMVMLVEDIHWIDERSEEALAALVDVVAAAPVLLAITYRPGYTPALGERSFYNRISLRQLASGETSAIIESMLSTVRLPEGLHHEIVEKAGGNPFYVEEITRSLMESGAVRRDGDVFEFTRAVSEIRIPDTIQEVILTRIDRLHQQAREALQLASVIGREFAARLLSRIADAEAGMEDLLGELKTLELIYEKSYFPELSYMFKHALTHEVAQSTLLAARRRELHRLVASAVEELYADRLPEQYDMLAHHYYEGQEWDKAAVYLVCAARKAAETFANKRAAELYGRAVEIIEREPLTTKEAELATLRHERAECYLNLGQWVPALEEAERALSLCPDDEREFRAEVLITASMAAFWTLNSEKAREYAHGARDLGESLGRLDQVARATAMLGAVAGADGEVAEGAALFRQAMEDADNFKGVPVIHQVLAFNTLNLYWGGSSAEAIESADACIPTARDLDEVAVLMSVMPHRGLALAAAGRYSEAISTFEEARTIGTNRNADTLLARAIAMYGGVHLDLADYEGALALATEARDLARALKFAPPLVSSSIDILFNMARRGEADGADAVIAEISDAVASTAGWHGWLWNIRFAQARAELAFARGDYEQALALSEEAFRDSKQKGRTKYCVAALITRGRTLAATGRKEEAVAALRDGVVLAAPTGDPAMLLRAASAHAEVEPAADVLASARSAIDAIVPALPEGRLRDVFAASAPVRLVERLTA